MAIWSNTAFDPNAGVPNVFQNTLVEFSAFGAEIPVGGQVDNDIHTFGSLNIQALSHNAANPLILELDFYQSNVAGSSNPFSEYLTIPKPFTGLPYTASWLVPVYAGSIRIKNLGGTTAAVVMYGSNRTAPSLLQLGNNGVGRAFTYVGPTTASVSVPFTAVDSLPDITTFNRNVYYSFTAGAMTGQLYISWIQPDGTIRNTFVAACALNASITGTVPHPQVPCQWLFLPGANSAANTAQLSLYQSLVA